MVESFACQWPHTSPRYMFDIVVKTMDMRTVGFTLALWAILCQNVCLGAVRTFYIACSEETWDYAPGSTDETHFPGYNQESFSPLFLNQSSNRIGHMYKKAIYREYTDDTYSIQKPKPDWLGFIGPVLMAESGDVMTVKFKNKASKNYTIHPHGVFYSKAQEGAAYTDGDRDRDGDSVPPGGSHTYTWTVTDASSPSEGDPDCITWLYHSHVSPVEDISSGLVGFLLTCRKGALARWKETRLYALYVSVIDENLSWYLDDNIATYINGYVDKDDKKFQESNKMHAINGYVYGHLPGLSAYVGETIHWHMASLGSTVDVHSLAVSGHSFEYFHHRTDSVRLTAAEFVTAEMTALTRGKWLISCQVNSHVRAGMEAFITIDNHNDYERPETSIVNTRRYYITAEEVMWDYGPSGRNKYDGGSLTEEGSDSEVFFKKDSTHIGGVYKKALFHEYTDFLFREKKVRAAEEEHLGFLGPVIRAEVGDLVKVVFYNKASRPYSIHPHGVRLTKLDEGFVYKDDNNEKGDDMVEPNRLYTYYWTIPEEMSPTLEDPPCLTRMYTSGVDIVKDSYSGLVGPLLICRKGSLDEYGKQVNVTKEFFLMFSVTDENKSWYLEDNINITGVDLDVDRDGKEFLKSNLMHGINGRLCGNLDGLDMRAGGVVSWHIFSIGTESDVHTVVFNGDSFLNGQVHRSQSELLPGSMRTMTMVHRHSGSWGLSCGSHQHFIAGTKAIYNVTRNEEGNDTMSSPLGGKTVRKYIQATERDWNYVPNNRDVINDKPIPNLHVASSSRIGTVYTKALYVEYTDDSFTTPVHRSRDETYLGLLGPIIMLEVGDVLEIVFKNNASERNYTVKAQGLLYTGFSDDSFNSMTQPSIMPGNTFTYRWNVTESSGPSLGDPECITRVYHSDVNAVKDVNSGLIGPVIVCRAGALKLKSGKRVRKHADKDFAVYFSVIDENESWYFDRNVNRIVGDPLAIDVHDDSFVNSNHLPSINGFLYGNQPIPSMTEGNIVDWYLITMGDDIHSVHFHGNDFENKQHTTDVIQLFPAMSATVRMRAVNPGKWLYYCHSNDHYAGGMQAVYEVMKDFLGLFSRASN